MATQQNTKSDADHFDSMLSSDVEAYRHARHQEKGTRG